MGSLTKRQKAAIAMKKNGSYDYLMYDPSIHSRYLPRRSLPISVGSQSLPKSTSMQLSWMAAKPDKASDIIPDRIKPFFETRPGRVVAKPGKLAAEGGKKLWEGFLSDVDILGDVGMKAPGTLSTALQKAKGTYMDDWERESEKRGMEQMRARGFSGTGMLRSTRLETEFQNKHALNQLKEALKSQGLPPDVEQFYTVPVLTSGKQSKEKKYYDYGKMVKDLEDQLAKKDIIGFGQPEVGFSPKQSLLRRLIRK